MPYRSPYSWLNTTATATTEVTIGARMASRHTSCPRMRRLRALAISSAASSCGTVAMTNMATVLTTEFQNGP